MAGIGEIAQMAAHRVLGRVEFGCEFRRQHAALRTQPFQNQPFAFLGQKPVHCVLSGSLHERFSLG